MTSGELTDSCPWRENNFSQAIKKGGSGLKVYDIVELVEKAI